MNLAYFLVDKRIFSLLIALVLGLYFLVVNSASLKAVATTYLLGALIVLASLPLLRMLFKR